MTAMSALEVLVPLSIAMGCLGLYAFFWSLRTRQYEDLRGAAERILFDDDDEACPQAAGKQNGPAGVHHQAPTQGECRET